MSRRKAAKGRRRHYTVVVPVQHMITLADCSVCSQKATGPCESYFLPIQYKTEIPKQRIFAFTHSLLENCFPGSPGSVLELEEHHSWTHSLSSTVQLPT